MSTFEAGSTGSPNNGHSNHLTRCCPFWRGYEVKYTKCTPLVHRAAKQTDRLLLEELSQLNCFAGSLLFAVEHSPQCLDEAHQILKYTGVGGVSPFSAFDAFQRVTPKHLKISLYIETDDGADCLLRANNRGRGLLYLWPEGDKPAHWVPVKGISDEQPPAKVEMSLDTDTTPTQPPAQVEMSGDFVIVGGDIATEPEPHPQLGGTPLVGSFEQSMDIIRSLFPGVEQTAPPEPKLKAYFVRGSRAIDIEPTKWALTSVCSPDEPMPGFFSCEEPSVFRRLLGLVQGGKELVQLQHHIPVMSQSALLYHREDDPKLLGHTDVFGAVDPEQVSHLEADEGHFKIVMIEVVGPYKIYEMRPIQRTLWATVTSRVMGPLHLLHNLRIVRKQSAVKFPVIADVVAPNDNAKYRMLYRLVRERASDEAKGYISAAMQEEMVGEARSGVEPIEVLASYERIAEKFTKAFGAPPGYGLAAQ